MSTGQGCTGAAAPGTRLDEYLEGRFESPLGAVVAAIAAATALIAERVREAPLAGLLGETGEVNVQGERVQRLDDVSNRALQQALSGVDACAGYASEELEEPVLFERAGAPGQRGQRYLVAADPLDGSTNIDVNVSIGTIFGVWPAGIGDAETGGSGFVRPGREQVAAGYALYGPGTTLVLTDGVSVDGFTLATGGAGYLLSRPAIRCPARGGTYSINEGYFLRWPDGLRDWVRHLKAEDPGSGRPYSHRYVGSLVSDAHRTLVKGGVFAYPADSTRPHGKLRLGYEANPFALVFEAAGGAATDGARPILDIQPSELHQRTPLVVGSREDIETYTGFLSGKESGSP